MWANCRESNLLLVGFMGAGKTTVAQAFCLSGYDFIDLDEVIVRHSGRSIQEIFSTEGESFFRDLETEALRSLAGIRRTVVATGGGIVGREENWALMRQLGPVVYLRSPWDVLQKRLAAGEGRPLANSADWSRVEALWRQRLPLYEKADLIVETENLSPVQIAENILEYLKGEGEGTWKS